MVDRVIPAGRVATWWRPFDWRTVRGRDGPVMDDMGDMGGVDGSTAKARDLMAGLELALQLGDWEEVASMSRRLELVALASGPRGGVTRS